MATKKRGPQEKTTTDNSFGVGGVIFGIMSILSLSFAGIIMGIIGLVFSLQQQKRHKNLWSKTGIVLNIAGIIIGIIAIIIVISFIQGNAETYFAQLQGQ